MSTGTRKNLKSSGVEWLGDVPEHWEILPVRYVARLESGHTPSRSRPEWWENCTVPWFALADIWQVRQEGRSVITDTAEKVSELGLANSSARVLPKGTVMLSRTASVGFAAIMGVDMATTQDFANWVCGPRLNNEFLLWTFRAMRPEFERLMMGSTHNTIYMPDIASFRFALPPLSEQTVIAAFLDRDTGKIDALVQEQRWLIELLKEKRQAVISHAVTKGLDPNANVKPSGVEWLGDVPEHWDVTPLMRLTAPGRDIMYGIVLPGPDVEDGVPIVKGGDVRPHRLRLDLLNRTTPEIEASFARARLRPNDIVYSIRGTIGDAELVPPELLDANITQDVARVSPRPDINVKWLLYALKSDRVFVQLEQLSLGAAVRGINIYDLKRARVPLPPRSEQEAIAEHLDTEVTRLDALAEQAIRAVRLLEERRSALISAAVTGKIALPEPAEVPLQVTRGSSRARLLVAAEIIDLLSHKRTFGRVKLQKLLYLAEAEAGIRELDGRYTREAAGPLDRDLVADVEVQLQRVGHATVIQSDARGSAVTYRLTGTKGFYRHEMEHLLGERSAVLGHLTATLGDLNTKSVEAITTLYAVWNDALLDHRKPGDDEIVSGVLKDWHPEKAEKFTTVELRTWLCWMRRNNLVPRGEGPRTVTGRLFV